jgi:rhamnogalacturonan acetylesterase
MGLGTLIRDYFDATKINISNQAMAGRSTRTFIKELEGAKLNAQIVVGQIKAIKPGKLHTYLH